MWIHSLGESIAWYRNLQTDSPDFCYYTISFNNEAREFELKHKNALQHYNHRYISVLENMIEKSGEFEQYTIDAIINFQNSWLSLTRELRADELLDLWEHLFGWSREACENLLDSTDGSFVLWVRQKTDEAVSVILFSD